MSADQRHGARSEKHEDAATSEERAVKLISAGSHAAFGERSDPRVLDEIVNDLIVFPAMTSQTDQAERAATRIVLGLLAQLYENGWQPADVMHATRRMSGVRGSRLARSVLLQQAALEQAAALAPDDWVAQLESVADGELHPVAAGWSVIAAQPGPGGSVWDGWHDALTLLGQWSELGALPQIVAPPSTWGKRRRSTPSRPATGPAPISRHNPKMLTRIRALLAKAEATEFSQEADAFTSKAQDLMTRYAIDEALLADETHGIEVRSRRVHIDNPYASTKAQLLAAVGTINRVKAIWDDDHGIATIVGLPVDLELTEMLFISLLVQATRAMTEAGAISAGGHRVNRSPSFRRAFLMAYAIRIGERLSQAEQHAQQEESMSRGVDLLPVLARQSAAVDREFARLFPQTRTMGAKRVDARGWQAGRAAADRALLAKAQVSG